MERKYPRFISNVYFQGFVNGYGGAQHADNTITRAEFVTVLYRIAQEFEITLDKEDIISNGIVIIVLFQQ